MIDVAIAGVSGRMGQALYRELELASNMCLTRALVSSTSKWLGHDLGELSGSGKNNIVCTNECGSDFDVLIDFSTVEASLDYIKQLEDIGKPVVLCTTGFDQYQQTIIEQTSLRIPLLKASNTSLGMAVLVKLAHSAARMLADADIEIIEMHHSNKVDAPSGSAITLGETVADARGTSLDNAIYHRHGKIGVRPAGAIGFSSIRAGDIAGDHTVLLAMDQERIELSHKAVSRSIFAKGAIKAARWLVNQQPGRIYSMDDVLSGPVR